MRREMGSGASVCWGLDVSTLGSYVSTLGVGYIASGKRTLVDCTAGGSLCTLGVGVVRGMQALRLFPRFQNFGVAL